MNFANFSNDAPCFDEQPTTEQYLKGFSGHGIPALALLPGFNLSMLMVDFMHTDLSLWIAANMLIELCEENVFGCFRRGRWKQRIDLTLRAAWRQFRTWCKDHGIVQSQS